MTTLGKFSLYLVATSVIAAPAAFAGETSHGKDITTALADSKVNVSFRARYEGVDQDVPGGTDKDATALTLKSRLTVKTGAYKNFSAVVELDNTTALVDNYNDLTLDYSGNDAVVADPEITDVNQAYIKYNQGKFVATAGRQRILHNNQRFIGGVGWRQNEQTYDGVRLQYKMSDALSFDYSYIHNANRIFANAKKGADLGGDFHFLNSTFKVNKQHKISAFAYILDFEKAVGASTTVGGLYNGKFGPIFVNASLASQSDNADNPANFTASYINAEVGTKFSGVTVLGGYELLGSDNGVAFSTPFATLHKFNGWADQFLGTPGAGIQDIYLTAKTKVKGIKLSATYHNLTSDEGSIDYGSEIDVVAAYSINKNYGALVKLASYSADDHNADISKLWIQLTAKF